MNWFFFFSFCMAEEGKSFQPFFWVATRSGWMPFRDRQKKKTLWPGPHRQQSKMIVAVFFVFLDSNVQCTIVGIKEGGKKKTRWQTVKTLGNICRVVGNIVYRQKKRFSSCTSWWVGSRSSSSRPSLVSSFHFLQTASKTNGHGSFSLSFSSIQVVVVEFQCWFQRIFFFTKWKFGWHLRSVWTIDRAVGGGGGNQSIHLRRKKKLIF